MGTIQHLKAFHTISLNDEMRSNRPFPFFVKRIQLLKLAVPLAQRAGARQRWQPWYFIYTSKGKQIRRVVKVILE